MLGMFFTQLADVFDVDRPQDAGGGEVPTPEQIAAMVPCVVQQDGGPDPRESKESRQQRGSSADVAAFFASDPGVRAGGRLRIRSAAGAYLFTITLDGPAFDRSGQAGGSFLGGFAAWEARGVIRR